MEFKHTKDVLLFNDLKKALKNIIVDMSDWAKDNGCPFLITATISSKEEDAKEKRVSTSHQEGRAVDISTKGWDALQIKDFLNYFMRKYKKFGAVSKSDGVRKLIVYGDSNHLDHFHIQVARGFE